MIYVLSVLCIVLALLLVVAGMVVRQYRDEIQSAKFCLENLTREMKKASHRILELEGTIAQSEGLMDEYDELMDGMVELTESWQRIKRDS